MSNYFQDRPEVMAQYCDVRLEAEKGKYPLQFSNGSEMGSGIACRGRH